MTKSRQAHHCRTASMYAHTTPHTSDLIPPLYPCPSSSLSCHTCSTLRSTLLAQTSLLGTLRSSSSRQIHFHSQVPKNTDLRHILFIRAPAPAKILHLISSDKICVRQSDFDWMPFVSSRQVTLHSRGRSRDFDGKFCTHGGSVRRFSDGLQACFPSMCRQAKFSELGTAWNHCGMRP